MAATTGKSPSSPLPHNQRAAAQLLLDLFDSQPTPLAMVFAQWMTTSKPFMLFAQKYQPKIRKKIRMSRDVEETHNLYCELRTAYLLLQEPKFALAYEPYGLREGRSADFAVTFRTRTTFHVEVTRLRTSQQEQQLYRQGEPVGESASDDPTGFIRRYESRRLTNVVCDKFQQLAPDTPNILWVWGESRVMHELDVGRVMLDLKRRAEQKDADLFTRFGFGKPADLIRYYQRLGAIVVQSLHPQAPNSAPLWWQNNDTKYPLPSKVINLLHSLTTSDTSPAFTAQALPYTPDDDL